MLKSLLRNKELEIKVSLCLLAFFFPPNQGGLENFYLILTDMAGGGGLFVHAPRCWIRVNINLKSYPLGDNSTQSFTFRQVL